MFTSDSCKTKVGWAGKEGMGLEGGWSLQEAYL